MNNLRNNVQLIGRLGQTPEIKSFENGSKVANFSIAVNNGYRDNSGNWIENTQWFKIVAWGKNADAVTEKMSKGSEVLITGRLDNHDYTAKDGTKRYVTDVVMNSYVVLAKREKDGE